MTIADAFVFARAWASHPLRVGAVAPSGRALAELITSRISSQTGLVLELGPGTGVFTRALLARGVRECEVTLVESSSDFAPLLRRRFPAARLLRMDATRLARTPPYEDALVGAVVCGLPLLSMSPRAMTSVLSGAFARLEPGGSFYQFTYGPRCPVPRRVLDRLGLKATRIGHTLLNVPPAAVYEVTRRSPTLLSRVPVRTYDVLLRCPSGSAVSPCTSRSTDPVPYAVGPPSP
jgi:phospholipid N-methyltransferase